MKIWFTFILSLVFSIAGYTQLLELFSGHKASLSEWEINVSDLEKLKLIEPLRSSKLFEWPFNNLDNCQECLNSFHIIDFDLDGRKDILYYGLLGGESQYLVIIRNTNESFRELLVVAGSLNFVSLILSGTLDRVLCVICEDKTTYETGGRYNYATTLIFDR